MRAMAGRLCASLSTAVGTARRTPRATPGLPSTAPEGGPADKRHPLTQVHSLLLGGDEALPSGMYRPSEWKVVIPVGLSEEQRRLPSAHESMHAALTDSTAFGTALHVFAWLGRFAPDGERYLSVLDALVDSCRHVQEYFATYVSVDVLRRWISVENLLADYPEYAEYYRIAGRLTALPGLRLPYHGVKTVARVCMQSRVLDTVQAQGLTGFRIADLHDADRPDRRLRELRPILTEGFWRDALESFAESGVERWPEVLALNGDRERHGELASGEFTDALHRFDVHVYERLRIGLLERSGIETLTHDGHVDPTRALIAEASLLAPDAAFPLYLDADSPVERREEALRTFAEEQLVVRRGALPAQGWPLDLSDPVGVEPFLIGRGTEEAHYFFVVRSRRQLLTQYDLDDATRDWLGSHGDEYVVALRRHDGEAPDDVRVVLGFVGGLSELPSLASLDGAAGFLLGNVPMSILRLPGFDRLLDGIPRDARLTMLFDLSPLAQFERWRQGGHIVRYAPLTVDAPSPIERAFVFEHSAMPDTPFIAPCSEQMLQLLLDFAEQEATRYGSLRSDESMLEVNYTTLSLTITHLALEESSFSFRGDPV